MEFLMAILKEYIFLFRFSVFCLLFAGINWFIQKKVWEKYYIFLNALFTLLSLHIERMSSLKETGVSLNEIKNKVFYKDMNLILSQLMKYEQITNDNSEILEEIILKLYLVEPPELEATLKLKIKVAKVLGYVKRKHKFTRYVFAPWNWINNFSDILIFIFLDYEYYFLQPQTLRTKDILSKIYFAVAGLCFFQHFFMLMK